MHLLCPESHTSIGEILLSNGSPADGCTVAKISESELILKFSNTSELFDFKWVIQPNFKISLSPNDGNDAIQTNGRINFVNAFTVFNTVLGYGWGAIDASKYYFPFSRKITILL